MLNLKTIERISKIKDHQPTRRGHYAVQPCVHVRVGVCTVPHVRNALLGVHVLCIAYILDMYTNLVYAVGPQK